MDLFAIGDLIMLVAILGALTFTLSYGTFFAWRKTPAGRSLLYFVCALDAWAIQSFVARVNPDYWGREYLRILVYTLIAITVWRMVFSLWRAWKSPFTIEIREKPKNS